MSALGLALLALIVARGVVLAGATALVVVGMADAVRGDGIGYLLAAGALLALDRALEWCGDRAARRLESRL